MADKKLVDRVRSATKVNLSYGATFFDLSKQYITEISTALLSKPGTAELPDHHKAKSAPAQGHERPPLIVAGRSGEIAHAAMAINSTTDADGILNFKIIGDFPGVNIFLDPESVDVGLGKPAIIRIMAEINDSIPEGMNYPGVIAIVELNVKVAEFVLRRLPDLIDDERDPLT